MVIEQLVEQAERVIDCELKQITISLDGSAAQAIAVINAFMGIRLLGIDRCEVLKDQARRISTFRKMEVKT